MAWQQRQPEWLNSPWNAEYYPGQAGNYPWLVENDDVDWVARTPPS